MRRLLAGLAVVGVVSFAGAWVRSSDVSRVTLAMDYERGALMVSLSNPTSTATEPFLLHCETPQASIWVTLPAVPAYDTRTVPVSLTAADVDDVVCRIAEQEPSDA